MRLNVEKILNELDRLEKSQAWLAGKVGRSQQIVNYWIREASLKGAEPIGKALNINPRDLIK